MKTLKLLATGTLLATLGGCATAISPVGNGLLFTDVSGPVTISDNAATNKNGKSCATNILGLIASGDASISAAKEQGEITKVSNVDYHSNTILGLFSQSCTIVKGQ